MEVILRIQGVSFALQNSCAVAMEVLSMRPKYLHDIVDVGVDQAHQVANLVEGSYDVAHSSAYRTPRAALITTIELEVSKEISKARLGTVKKKDGATDADKSD